MWHCSTWTQGNICLKPQKYKVIPVLDIFKTWARNYRHKCRSISTLKKMLKAKFETEYTMGVWCPTYLLHKIKEMCEGPKYETTFRTVFRTACRWTDLKGSNHQDPWMLAITNKEAVTAEGLHYGSCYQEYTFGDRSLASWVVNLKHCMRQQKDNHMKNSLHTSETNSCQIQW